MGGVVVLSRCVQHLSGARDVFCWVDFTSSGGEWGNGSYRMSQTQAADCVGKPEINARRFLSSRAIKTLLGEGYTPDSLEIEKDEQLPDFSRHVEKFTKNLTP